MKMPRINWRGRLSDVVGALAIVLVFGVIFGIVETLKLAFVDDVRWACAVSVVFGALVFVWLVWSWLAQDDFEDRP